MRRSILSMLALLGLFLLLPQAAPAQEMAQGLYVETFRIIAPTPAHVGDTIAVEMTLVNNSGHSITFHPDFGVFVGCRWNSTSDANNRDFGHDYKGYTIGTGRPVHIYAQRVVDAAGTWRFWPAFNIDGHWGPFRWQEQTLEVYAQGRNGQGGSGPGGPGPGGPGPGMGLDVVMFPSSVISHPGMHDGHRMMLQGNVLFVQTLTVGSQEYLHVWLQDPEQPVAVVPVLCRTDAQVWPGYTFRFTGTFSAHAQWGGLNTEPGLDATNGSAQRID